MLARRNQIGIAFIELVVLVSVLGLLAAFAVPRLSALEIEVRTAATQVLGGQLRSEAAFAHALWLAESRPQTVSIAGAEITLVNGYPNAATIDRALPEVRGFVYTPGVVSGVFSKAGATGTCEAIYTEASVLGVPPMIILDVSGC